MKSISLLLGVILLVGCGGGDNSEANIMPIYNQAYQENFEPDSINIILTEAEEAYVLVDPFGENIPEYVESIKEKDNQVSGYISVGTGENWREDFASLEPYLTTKGWDEWEGEFYVSETTTGIVEVMKKRIDKMATWGMDWVEFDNMDWWSEETKEAYNLKVTQEEATAYINTLCNYTRQKGMKCMAKNIVKGFEDFDGVLYESSSDNKNWWDQAGTKLFLKENKLVIINHYNESDCDGAYKEYQRYYDSKGISFICEDIELEGYRHYN